MLDVNKSNKSVALEDYLCIMSIIFVGYLHIMVFDLFGILLRLYQSYVSSGQGRFPEFEQWLLQNLLQPQVQPPTQDFSDHDLASEDLQLTDFSTDTFRVYSQQEIQKLNANCRGYLLKLELDKVISATTRERIIQEALGINKNLELDDIEYLTQDILMEEQESTPQELQLHKIVDENQNQILH